MQIEISTTLQLLSQNKSDNIRRTINPHMDVFLLRDIVKLP